MGVRTWPVRYQARRNDPEEHVLYLTLEDKDGMLDVGIAGLNSAHLNVVFTQVFGDAIALSLLEPE